MPRLTGGAPRGTGDMQPDWLYNGCMVSYTLRIPEETYEQIKQAAVEDQRSIQREMLWLMDQGMQARDGGTS